MALTHSNPTKPIKLLDSLAVDISRRIEKLGKKILAHGDRIQRVGPNLAKFKKILKSISKDIDSCSDHLEIAIPQMKKAVGDLGQSWLELSAEIKDLQAGELPEVEVFYRGISDLKQGAAAGIDGLSQFREAMVKVQGDNLAQQVTDACRRLVGAVDQLLSVFRNIDGLARLVESER